MSVRVLIVDDSRVVREIFARELSRDPDIEVVGTAEDVFVARDMIVRLRPDVVTLDIEMPRMDGITFLRKLMRHYPLPVIVVTGLSERGGERAVAALEAGCVDVICKPHISFRLPELSVQLVEKIKAAVRVRLPARDTPFPEPRSGHCVRLEAEPGRVVAIGASTGGPRAIHHLLGRLTGDIPPILVAQHMPETFTASFARRLDADCSVSVKEAEDGELLRPGVVLVAPGNRHLVVQRRPTGLHVRVKGGPLVCCHRPSVDVLFRSLARTVGSGVVGVLLTGMGEDGAEGLLELRRAGAVTIAEAAESCVVHGMPRAAVERGAATQVVRLEQLASSIAVALRPARSVARQSQE